MKFKLDENLGTLGQAELEAAGYDVSTVARQQMSGASDAVLYDTCKNESRIMVTLDHDFGEVLRFPPEDTAGIIILECRGRLSPATILARVNE